MEEKERLDKSMGKRGISSRRESKELIIQGKVLINDKIVKEPSFLVSEKDSITLKGKTETRQKETFLVYKPKGYLSSPEDSKHPTLFKVFPNFKHLSCVGRLDKETEGLILMSNDGLITRAVTATGKVEKEYEVRTREDVTLDKISKLEKGVRLEGGYTTKQALAKKINKNTLTITLKEGKKHQVRRMANAVNLTILNLKRIRIDKMVIGKMKPGHFRKLTEKEVSDLKSYLCI